MDRSFVILDTETAAQRGAPHLVELGAVRVIDGEVADRFETFVRPEVPVDPEATACHGITDDDVADAPRAAEVLARFSEWIGEDWLAAHNAGFDARVLGFEYTRASLEPPRNLMLDSLPLARKLIPEAENHKLETLCEVLGLEEGRHHRALADAVWCWKVIEACAERMGGLARASVPEIAARCGATFTIATSAPRLRAHVPRRLRPLAEACGSRARVTLIYGDGESQPAALAVLPRLLYELGDKRYLEAECVASGMLKTYRLDRVHHVRV